MVILPYVAVYLWLWGISIDWWPYLSFRISPSEAWYCLFHIQSGFPFVVEIMNHMIVNVYCN